MYKPSDKGKIKKDKVSELIELAKEEFESITNSEKKLFQAVVKGEFADYSAKEPKDNNPANSKDWEKERILKANIIIWLCNDTQASAQITRFGIKVKGARIDGEFNLQYTRCSFPLFFEKCAFSRFITLEYAEFTELYFPGSYTGSINAEFLKVEGNVNLSDGFKAEGVVSLACASIGGQLICSDSQFINPKENGDALFAEGLQINADVFMSEGFKAEGIVSLAGASIGGQLDCSGGQFSNPKEKGVAIFAQGLQVKGDVFMSEGFKAEGVVSLVGASIGGQLNCRGGQFINPKEKGVAISAEGLQVNGDVIMSEGFKAEGVVSLVGASIGGALACSKGQFINPKDIAIIAENLQVNGGVFMSEGFKAEGVVSLAYATILGCFVWTEISSPEDVELRLNSAKVDMIWDHPKSWPNSGNLFIAGLIYEGIDKNSPIDAKNRIDWLRRQPKEPFVSQPYEQLAAVLRKIGHEGEAKKILIAKSKDRGKFGKLTKPERFWHLISGLLIGYGYHPWRAFLISLFVIALGWGIFAVGYKVDAITPTKEWAYISDADSQSRRLSDNYPIFNPLVYSLDVFVPLVDLHMASYWMPNANQQGELLIFRRLKLPIYGRALRICMWIHILLGWTLTTVWVGGLTGLIRK